MHKNILTLLCCALVATACNDSLIISEDLSSEQRKDWRTALDFPAYCEGGKYEWLDLEDMPYIYFKPLNDGNTLVINVCERFSYQDEVNLFSYHGSNSKPEVITFPVYTHIEGTDNDSKKSGSIKSSFKSELSKRLLKRGIEVLDNGNISVTNHYNGPGTCGTLITYDISTAVAKVVEFRAQVNCENSQHDMNKWPIYSLD